MFSTPILIVPWGSNHGMCGTLGTKFMMATDVKNGARTSVPLPPLCFAPHSSTRPHTLPVKVGSNWTTYSTSSGGSRPVLWTKINNLRSHLCPCHAMFLALLMCVIFVFCFGKDGRGKECAVRSRTVIVSCQHQTVRSAGPPSSGFIGLQLFGPYILHSTN